MSLPFSAAEELPIASVIREKNNDKRKMSWWNAASNAVGLKHSKLGLTTVAKAEKWC